MSQRSVVTRCSQSVHSELAGLIAALEAEVVAVIEADVAVVVPLVMLLEGSAETETAVLAAGAAFWLKGCRT